MSTEKAEKNDCEVSFTRRKLIKTAAWIVPAIVAVQLTKGKDVFVHASSGGETCNNELQGLLHK